MATSPSESDGPPPEVIAIAVGLATTLLAPGTYQAAADPPDAGRGGWRWQGWD